MMQTIGKNYKRMIIVIVLCVLLFGLAFNPSVIAAPTPDSDDFSETALNTSFWTLENEANGSPEIVTAGDESYLQMVVPPGGGGYNFSDDKKNAPVAWHSIPNGDFEYEVKFLTPLYEEIDGNYKVAGILLRDTSVTPTKYLRFDFNAEDAHLNGYIGYMNGQPNHLVHIYGPSDLPGAAIQTEGEGLYLQVQKTGTDYNVRWQVGDSGVQVATFTFSQDTYDANFTISDIGIFAGSTGTAPPGATVRIDYFRDVADACFVDDGPFPPECGDGPVPPTQVPPPVDLPFDFWLPFVGK